MSSFDSVSSRRPSRGYSAPCSRGRSPEYKPFKVADRYHQPQQQAIPKYYFFGSDELIRTETERPSTLPRRPLHRPLSSNTVNQDPNRFYSIPRTKTPREERSPSHSRGHSVPAPVVNSGPVTTTIIGPCFKNVFNSLPRGISMSQDNLKFSPRTNFESLTNLGRANSSDDFWTTPRRKNITGVKLRDDEGGGHETATTTRKAKSKIGDKLPFESKLNSHKIFESKVSNHLPLESKVNGHLPFDSGVGEISRDTNDEGHFSSPHHSTSSSRVLLPRSNTSISNSGFASSATRLKKPSEENYVRRTQSFQARPSRRFVVDDDSNRNGGHVAKFVQKFEKGIHQTFVNMNSFKPPTDSPTSSCSRESLSSPGGSREDGRHLDLSSGGGSSSDVVLDNRKITPQGDDYRLVFISSDSSKESELNSSLESDGLSSHLRTTTAAVASPRITNWKDRIRQNLSGSSWNEPEQKKKKSVVDVAVNTEEPYVSDEESDDDDPIIYDATNEAVSPAYVHRRRTSSSSPSPLYNHNHVKEEHQPLIGNLTNLNPKNLRLMLEQTEVVQAEAQALQKALMGAFDSSEVTSSPHHHQHRNSRSRNDWRNQTRGDASAFEGHRQSCHEPRNVSNAVVVVAPLHSVDDVNGRYGDEDDDDPAGEMKKVYGNRREATATKTICIQTDLGPPSWDDDSSGTGDDAVSSYDDDDVVSRNNRRNVFSDRSTTTTATATAEDSRTATIPGCEGTEEGKVPLRSHLPVSPPQPPSTVYLHNDSTSVSLSSQCESVGAAVWSRVNPGHFGVHFQPKCSSPSTATSLTKSYLFSPNNKSTTRFREIKNDDRNGPVASWAFRDVPTDNSCGLTGGSSRFDSTTFQRAHKMNVAQKHSSSSSNESPPPDPEEAAILPSRGEEEEEEEAGEQEESSVADSSGTSEGEDTDEEVHVSRSYDVSQLPDDSDSNKATTSDSDDTELDNPRRLVIIGSSNSREEVEVIAPGSITTNDDESERAIVAHPQHHDNDVDSPPSSSSVTGETTELPECDQAIEDAVVVVDGEAMADGHLGRLQRLDSRSDCENIENKSETESTIGLDADLDPIKEDRQSPQPDLVAESKRIDDDDRELVEESIGDTDNENESDNRRLLSEGGHADSEIVTLINEDCAIESVTTISRHGEEQEMLTNIENVTLPSSDIGECEITSLQNGNETLQQEASMDDAHDNVIETDDTPGSNEIFEPNCREKMKSTSLEGEEKDEKLRGNARHLNETESETCLKDQVPLIRKSEDVDETNEKESNVNDDDDALVETDCCQRVSNNNTNTDTMTILSERNDITDNDKTPDKVESNETVKDLTVGNDDDVVFVELENEITIDVTERVSIKENNHDDRRNFAVVVTDLTEDRANCDREIGVRVNDDKLESALTKDCIHSSFPGSTVDDSECTECEITGSIEVERGSSCVDEAVVLNNVNEQHEVFSNSPENLTESDGISSTDLVNSDDINAIKGEISVDDRATEGQEEYETSVKRTSYSSESGHSSGGESEGDSKEVTNIVKIDVIENNIKNEGARSRATNVTSEIDAKLCQTKTFPKGSSRLRKTHRSSSSEGLSSSSDIERSDASDSADTVIDNKINFSKLTKSNKLTEEDCARDSDGPPSSADSLLHGADSESQCSDSSEEGNLVTIVAVGEDSMPNQSSQGKIYIRSDSTDSDVQIKPTCIVVSGFWSDEEDTNEERGDVTILEVTSDHRKDHVMSVRVTSPESSRNASPTRKNNVTEHQSMILSHRERQHHIRHSPVEGIETSSLTNYFTVTLGTESPLTPRRINKTPEVKRRKVIDRGDLDSPSSTPTVAAVPPPTLDFASSPSSHTPSPIDHSEGDLLAYEEHHKAGISQDPFLGENQFGIEEKSDEYFDVYHENEQYGDEFPEEIDGAFDSIEDIESIEESNYSETSSEEGYEREEELRGYCKRGYDFTLHTIIEESCEESDYDKKASEELSLKRDQSELEKYYYFGLGNGPADAKKYANEESEFSDTYSETSSSIFSEGIDSMDAQYENDIDPAELASSRLEKYFSGFAGLERQPSFRSVGEESEIHTDESDSVGSDSEGTPSPEQPRKKLFKSSKSRGVRSRSHGYSSDKGENAFSDGSLHSMEVDEDKILASSEDEASTESEETAFDKGDGQFDTIKRRKKKKLADLDKKSDSEKIELKFGENKLDEIVKKLDRLPDLDVASKKYSFEEPKSPREKFASMEGDLAGRKYQSRDSGFIGSSDDLLKDKPDEMKELENKQNHSSESGADETELNKNNINLGLKMYSNLKEEYNNKNESDDKSSNEGKVSRSSTGSSADLPPYTQSKGSQNLSRKDSFNNWSSDEETNIMMNKMRLFFKNMFSNGSKKEVPKAQRIKAPQLVMFEAKLTNLMRCVPGINDEQVKEIVEYLSSEETWSDSYDSSDYTSSDLEGAYARLDQTDPALRSELQEQISASCRQIIKKFDQSTEPSDNDSAHSFFGGRAGSQSSRTSSVISKDAAFVYNKLLSSISNMKQDSDRGSIGSGSQSTSPPLLMKVIHHIGDRIVALMHEVSAGSDIGDDVDSLNGGNPLTSSPRQKLFLPKKYDSADSSIDKSSVASGSFDSEDSPTDTEQSPESESGTPKIIRNKMLSIISERSSAEDFTSFESQKTNASSEYSRPHYTKSSQSSQSRSRWHGLSVDAEKFDGRDHHVGLPKMSRSGRRSDPRKAKSHMSLEKIQYDDMKTTGERSESLGDLLDRVRSSSEFSSSYEQLDSDSTLKASDSLDRQICSSSSNVRLNTSSRGSLTTSSRGSLATSSRGSLQGSSGAEEDEDRKSKKLSFFRFARRSSVPDATKDNPSPEMRSTTLPRSTPAHILTTGTLPRSQPSEGIKSLTSLTSPYFSQTDKPSGYPRSARYHSPGYRPPPAGLPPKRTYSTPTLRKERRWPVTDDSGACVDDSSASSSAITTSGVGPSRTPRRGGVLSNGSSRTASPLGGGSLGRTSGTDSVGESLASFETTSEEAKRRESSDGTRSPLMALGPKSRSESLASVYSTGADGRFGSVTIQGEILVALQYNYKEGQLECHVSQCKDLAPFDSKRNRSDPYVKAYLLPDKSKSGKRKTKVKRHSLNPVFEEIFKFGTTLSDMDSRTLWLSVWHSDMFGRNVFLGEILLPLFDGLFEDSSPKWYSLTDRNEPMEDLNYGAVLLVALKYFPPDVAAQSKKSKKSRGALHVRIKEATGLNKRSQSLPDPICKGVLMPEKGKSSKQKTNTVRRTCNPCWNHSMTFDDVTLQELTERSLELSVWDHDRFGSSEFLGGCRLNLGKCQHNNKMVQWLDASGLEQKLWEQMIDRPNLWVESSILLRPNIDRPIYSSAFTE